MVSFDESANRAYSQSATYWGHENDAIEGIYLLRRPFQAHYDLSFWVDCTFETALERALVRRQEGLSEAETIAAYRTIYFPAQAIHLGRDAPRAAASAIVVNDPRLASAAAAARGAR